MCFSCFSDTYLVVLEDMFAHQDLLPSSKGGLDFILQIIMRFHKFKVIDVPKAVFIHIVMFSL